MDGKYIFHAAMGVILVAAFAGIGRLSWVYGLGMVDYRAPQVEPGRPGGYRGPPLPLDARDIRIRQSGWQDAYLLLKFRAPAQQIDSFIWKLGTTLQPGIRLPEREQFLHHALLDDPSDDFHTVWVIKVGRSFLKTYQSQGGTWHGTCIVADDAASTLYYMVW